MVERLRDSGGEGGHGIGEAKGSLLAMVVVRGDISDYSG
jgi:hypothetical protein